TASGTCAPVPAATLARLIMPTNLCRIGGPDKAFTPHPAIVHRCLMRRWRVLSCLQTCAGSVGWIRRSHRIRQLCADA
ncbi:hypothetical protein, partial [Escherichia coli]